MRGIIYFFIPVLFACCAVGSYSADDINICFPTYPDGPHVEYASGYGDYIDGTIISECVYESNKRNGPFTMYYPNGNIKMKGNFQFNRKVGTWTYYYENGCEKLIGEYVNGRPCGAYSKFYENGFLKENGIYDCNNSQNP